MRIRLDIKGPVGSYTNELSRASEESILRAQRDVAEVAS